MILALQVQAVGPDDLYPAGRFIDGLDLAGDEASGFGQALPVEERFIVGLDLAIDIDLEFDEGDNLPVEPHPDMLVIPEGNNVVFPERLLEAAFQIPALSAEQMAGINQRLAALREDAGDDERGNEITQIIEGRLAGDVRSFAERFVSRHAVIRASYDPQADELQRLYDVHRTGLDQACERLGQLNGDADEHEKQGVEISVEISLGLVNEYCLQMNGLNNNVAMTLHSFYVQQLQPALTNSFANFFSFTPAWKGLAEDIRRSYDAYARLKIEAMLHQAILDKVNG